MILSLTDKEVGVLNYLKEAYTNNTIADRMNVSEQTVKNHISSIAKKVDNALGIPEEVNIKVWLAINVDKILNSCGELETTGV